MILSRKTENKIKDLKKLEDLFGFSNLDENHEVFTYKNKKVISKFKIETPKIISIDNFVCLRSKTSSFKCNDNAESKKKIKGSSKSQSKHKHNELEEFYNCFFGGEHQKECDKHFIRSLNHEMYLQKVRNYTVPLFDDKRCYISETEILPLK